MKTGRVANSPSTLATPHDVEEQPKKVLLRESKLELNQGLLERLRNPSQQVEFYEAIQQSMQSADKTPPKLLNSSANINPAGTALVEQLSPNSSPVKSTPPTATPHSFSTPKDIPATTAAGTNKASNRMPGNIVCGICGAVRYYSFILQAKKFGTFSCEPCRKFISKIIKKVKDDDLGAANLDCVCGTGKSGL